MLTAKKKRLEKVLVIGNGQIDTEMSEEEGAKKLSFRAPLVAKFKLKCDK